MTTPAQLPDTWLSAPVGDALVLFFGNLDASGRSWCPDCRNIEDTVQTQLARPGSYIVYVGDRAQWKTPDNRYRKDWSVTGIPTLVSVKDGKEVGRLEDELEDAEKVAAFVKKHYSE